MSALAVLGGSCLALQSRINGELGHQLGDGIAAATVSFGVGLVVMLLALPWMHRNTRRILDALRSGQLRWWQCIGGACGAFLVTTQGLTVPWLGVSIFIVALVAGQSASSLAMDRLGVGPGGQRLITRNRASARCCASWPWSSRSATASATRARSASPRCRCWPASAWPGSRASTAGWRWPRPPRGPRPC